MEFKEDKKCDIHDKCNSVSICVKWRTVYKRKRETQDIFDNEKQDVPFSSEDSIFDDREMHSRLHLCPETLEKLCEELKNPPVNMGETFLSENDEFNILPKNNNSTSLNSGKLNKNDMIDTEKMKTNPRNGGHGKRPGCTTPSYNIKSRCPSCDSKITKDSNYFMIRFECQDTESFVIHEDCLDNFIREAESIIENNLEKIVAGRI